MSTGGGIPPAQLARWIVPILLGVIGGAGAAELSPWGIASRLSALEARMDSMEHGTTTPMAQSTRERFDAMERRLTEASNVLRDIDARTRLNSELIFEIKGSLSKKQRRMKTSNVEREPLPPSPFKALKRPGVGG